MVDFVNNRNAVNITAESLTSTVFTIYETKTAVKNLSAFSTIAFEYFINGSQRKYTIPIVITTAVSGIVTATPVIATNWPTFDGTQTRKKGTAQIVFDNGLSTEFSTPSFPIEINRPA